MAGDWIKMNKSLARDPRVVRISSALNADRLRTVGGLFSVWCLADELTSDGMLDAYTPELLDEIAGLPGISHAMESVGWLVIGDGFLEFPRFERHNGQSSKRRAQEAVRKMSARNADKCPKESQTKCGPEKRREEKRRNKEELFDSIGEKPAPKRSVMPTKEEIVAYCLEIGLTELDGINRHESWLANGFTAGGEKVKDWKASIRVWKRKGYFDSQKQSAAKQTEQPTKINYAR